MTTSELVKLLNQVNRQYSTDVQAREAFVRKEILASSAKHDFDLSDAWDSTCELADNDIITDKEFNMLLRVMTDMVENGERSLDIVGK